MDRLDIHAVVGRIRQRHGLNSQPAVARYLQVTEKTLSNWLHRRNVPDNDKTALLAELAGMDQDVLLAYHEAMREKSAAGRERWLRVVRRLLLTANIAVPGAAEKSNADSDLAPLF